MKDLNILAMAVDLTRAGFYSFIVVYVLHSQVLEVQDISECVVYTLSTPPNMEVRILTRLFGLMHSTILLHLWCVTVHYIGTYCRFLIGLYHYNKVIKNCDSNLERQLKIGLFISFLLSNSKKNGSVP